MKLIVDENVDEAIATYPRERGHDALSICELLPSIADEEIVALSQRDGRRIVTNDLDLGDLAVRYGHASPGIVQLRFGQISKNAKMQAFIKWWPAAASTPAAYLVVLEVGGIRPRPL